MPMNGDDGSPSDATVNNGGDVTSGSTIWQRLFHRHDFRRPAVERLYGIYAYRSRLSDVRCLGALFIVLFLSLAAVDFAFAFRPSVDSVTHVALAAAASVAMVVLHTRLTTPGRLPAVGLFIIGVALVFAAVAMLPVAKRTSRAPAEGVWRLCYATFLVYALTPLRLYVALLYGLIVCAAHGLLAVATASDVHPGLLWRQVYSSLSSVILWIRKLITKQRLFLLSSMLTEDCQFHAVSSKYSLWAFVRWLSHCPLQYKCFTWCIIWADLTTFGS